MIDLNTFIACFSAVLVYAAVNFGASKALIWWASRKTTTTGATVSLDFDPLSKILSPIVKANEAEPKPPTFEESLKALETSRGTKILFLSHSIGSESGGLSALMSTSKTEIGYSDAQAFVTALRKSDPEQTLDIVVNTPGGSVAATEVIINALLNHKGAVNVFVPFCATSGGTLIAFAGDSIHMGKNAFLGPVDTQRFGFSIPSIYRALPSSADSTFAMLWTLLRDECKKDMDRTVALIRRISNAQPSWNEETLRQIDNTFASGEKYSHCQPLFYQDVAFLGNTTTDFPDEIYDIYQKYLDNQKAPSRGLLGSLF